MKKKTCAMAVGFLVATVVLWSKDDLVPRVTAPTAISTEKMQGPVSPNARKRSQALDELQNVEPKVPLIRELSPKEIRETQRYQKAIKTRESDEAAVLKAIRYRSEIDRMKRQAKRDLDWLRWCASNRKACNRQATIHVLKKKIRLYRKAGVSTEELESMLQNIKKHAQQGGEK